MNGWINKCMVGDDLPLFAVVGRRVGFFPTSGICHKLGWLSYVNRKRSGKRACPGFC